MIWRPSATVAAVIERDGQFLFVEEVFDGKRVLNQPAREVMEETAHEFIPRNLVGIYRWKYQPKDVTYLRFCFSGEVVSYDEKRKLDQEIVALHWLSFDELRKRKADHRSSLVQQCVDDYLAGRRYPLDVFSKEFA
jgi:hypothetical protein